MKTYVSELFVLKINFVSELSTINIYGFKFMTLFLSKWYKIKEAPYQLIRIYSKL